LKGKEPTLMTRKEKDLPNRFYTDWGFLGLLLIPAAIWLFIYYQTGSVALYGGWSLLQVVLIYPVIEEIIFRGILQPWIAQRWKQTLFKLSVANLITSGIFALLHLAEHSALWALATFIPSLIFGYSLERYNRLLAPIILHGTYNGGYFLIGATLVN
jgi:membrane protease YdiL (CAAX protease family)